MNAKTGLYGVRYVTADDVSKCMEAFNGCISGAARRGGNTAPPPSTSAGSETSTASLPKRFGIDHGGGAVNDCRVDGDSVTCTANWTTDNDSFSAEFTGTTSGMTMTGTTTTHRVGQHDGCTVEETYSGPVTYTFNPAGKVNFTAGPNQRQSTFSGGCSGSNSGTTVVTKGTATWSPTP